MCVVYKVQSHGYLYPADNATLNRLGVGHRVQHDTSLYSTRRYPETNPVYTRTLETYVDYIEHTMPCRHWTSDYR
jgi:hypothetical protein